MLLPYTTLTYYGQCAAAMVVEDIITDPQIEPHQQKRIGFTDTGTGSAEAFRPYRGRAFAFSSQGIGEMVLQSVKRIRCAVTVSIGNLSQDDVTGAVLEAPVENGLSLKNVLRILLAHAAGNASGLEGSDPVFKSQDGTKTRIAGTYASGTRTVTTIDGG